MKNYHNAFYLLALFHAFGGKFVYSHNFQLKNLKKIKKILLVLLLIPLSLTSQIKDSLNIEFESQKLEKYDLQLEKYEGDTYTKICTSNVPKMLKYSNAKAWIAKTFGDYKSVVQLEDQESCKIILKGLLELINEIEVTGKVGNITITPHIKLYVNNWL